MDFIKEKSWNIKTTKPYIKKPLGYVCYKCDLILKKNFVFALDQKWQLMSFFIQAREKGAKKAKKMDIAQTKTDIYKQQSLLSKIRWVTFFYQSGPI